MMININFKSNYSPLKYFYRRGRREHREHREKRQAKNKHTAFSISCGYIVISFGEWAEQYKMLQINVCYFF